MNDSYLLWNERQLPTHNPAEWRLDPKSFAHLDSLFLSCTQTSLPAAAQRKLVDLWCGIIPTLNVTSLVLGTKTNQKLVDAAFRLPGLRHLEIGWGGAKSLQGIANCRELTSLKIRSTPSLTGLATITVLDRLEVLMIENVKEAQDLGFVSGMQSLREFGICGAMWTDQMVDSLWPVARLRGLESLQLIGTKVLDDGLVPLHGMPNLRKLDCSYYYRASEFAALREATPSLVSGTPLELEAIQSMCKP